MGSSERPGEDLADLEAAIAALPPDSTLRTALENQRVTLLTNSGEPTSTKDHGTWQPAPPSDTDISDPDRSESSEPDPIGTHVAEDRCDAPDDDAAPPLTVQGSSQPDQTGRSSRTLLWAALAASLSVIVAIAVWFIAGYATVPDITNEDRGYAAGVLRSAGFEIETITEPDPDVAAGQVLGQQPDPGTRLRHGETITVIVAERPTHILTGSFVLLVETTGPDDNCSGTGGYSDVQGGVTVTVRDGSGTTLATGRLGSGERLARTTCAFPFDVAGIAQADFYAIEVGRRGELTFSHPEMEANGWDVGFSLG